MTRTKRAAPARVQAPSVFGEVLARLLRLVPGAAAATLIDSEGETVDFAGELGEFETKVAGAHFGVVADEARAALRPWLGRALQIVVRTSKKSFFVRAMPDGHALVLVLKRGAFGVSQRAVDLSVRDLAREAGWPSPSSREPIWYPVAVETSRDRLRPARVRARDAWERVEVLGSIVGLRRERGYRCRLPSGVELTLVRELAGIWYADERIDECDPTEPGVLG